MHHDSRSQKAKKFDQAYFERGTLEHGEGYRFDCVYTSLRPLARVWRELGVRRAIDIGCAKGALVKALLDEGVDAYGADVSKYAIEVSPVRERLY